MPTPSPSTRPRRRLAPCLAAALLLAGAPVPAAAESTPTRSFRVFSKSEWRGLPQSSVVALAQDADGLLWIGTLDGAATFDGRDITPVPDVAGAPVRGLIQALVVRRAGGVAVATQAGVHVFDGTIWRLVPTARTPVSLAEAADGTLWMADASGALWRLGDDGWQPEPRLSVAAIALAAAADGSLWVATPDGAARISEGGVEAVGGAPPDGRPSALLVARDGRVWIATQSCTVFWTRGGDDGWHQVAFAPWPRGAIRALAEDRRGRVWAVSYGGRVAFGTAAAPWTVWDSTNGPFQPGVLTVLGDREGHVWFGLNALGLAQWIGEPWSHRNDLDPSRPGGELFSAFTISRTASGEGLLVAAFASGALRIEDGTTRRWTVADGLTEDVRAVVEPEPGTLLAGTRFGIFESRDGRRFRRVAELPSGFVMGFFRSPEGRWYAATTSAGVWARDGERWRPDEAINAALSDPYVRAMTWRRRGELWVSTLRGVTVFVPGQPPVQLDERSNAAIPESVNAVLDVSDDEVWVAGMGGIAVRRGGAWRRMTRDDGLPGPTIYSLAAGADGTIWAGGSAGVGRWAEGRWKVFDAREGLLQEECNLGGLLVDDDGVVWVGTMAGLARFDPGVESIPPPELRLRWRDTPPRDGSGRARLEADQRALHLRWSAPWLGPHPVQYRVRVPRLRDRWSEAGPDDHLDVENLAAGEWLVEVAARVEGTQEWTPPLSLVVVVPPFWYETTPAHAAALALLGLAVYGVVRLRLRSLRRHAAMLEATVADRTAQLAIKMDELRESEQRALAASRAKSAFLANMSHELRTPLNGILGFAQLLRRRKGRDPQDREALGVIVRSGEHLLGLIDDVLSMAKIEAGRVTLEQREFDLRAVVRSVEDVLRMRAEEKGLAFRTELDALPAAVIGDELRLRQILLNLAGNAVKFTEQGSVTLRAAWRGGRARFEVADTGPGIAPDDLPRLFAPFVQSESGLRAREGTGLGLALSRDLARLMDGDITAQSTPGRGSCFRLDVRLPEADARPAPVEERQVAALAPGQPPVRILVVDDTAVNRAVLTRLLSAVGFEVREASDGETALSIWREWSPHFMWIDKRMPGLDGLETTRRIRAEEAATGRARMPIVALSASALDHERGEILDAGCDEFMAKPYRESALFAALARHLGVRYRYDEAEPAPSRSTRSSPAPSRGVHGAPSVLVVDDDGICLDVAAAVLDENGIGVTRASSGTEALSLVAASRFDLVLMDLHMPGMGGIETIRRIRATPGCERVPIVVMSAEHADDVGLGLAGSDDHLTKPLEPSELVAVLARWIPPAPPGG